jgi:hypothetical protein
MAEIIDLEHERRLRRESDLLDAFLNHLASDPEWRDWYKWEFVQKKITEMNETKGNPEELK